MWVEKNAITQPFDMASTIEIIVLCAPKGIWCIEFTIIDILFLIGNFRAYLVGYKSKTWLSIPFLLVECLFELPLIVIHMM